MKFQLLTVFVSLVIFGPPQIKGSCPTTGDQAIIQINACLSEFNSLLDFTKGPITATQLNNYCSSSARTTEIQCAENIVSDCRQTSSTLRRIIDKGVNIDGIRSSAKIVCNNTQIFAEKQDCIGRYQTTVTSCIISRYTSYTSRIQSLQTEAYSKGVEWFEEKAYEELCDYVGEIAVCQRPYGQNCGREIGDVFDALTHARRPPVCAGSMEYLTSTPAGTAVMENVNLILLITLAFVAVVKGNM